ncbi:MAG TPA: SPOR domain-containing protein [Azospirillum sp.]|nr:SPOR domain-containing protein [Azospirillum sp.]
MKYEGDANYATNPYGYQPSRPRRRGLVALGFAVVGTAAFAGVILYAYNRGERVAPDGGPPVIQADASPTKLRPEQPGGMDVPHQDKLVYDRLNHGGKDGRPQVEHLLPPPEQPLPRPIVTPQVPTMPELPPPPAVAPLPPPPAGGTTTVPRGIPDDVLPPVAPPPPVQVQAALPPALPQGGQTSEVAALPAAPPKAPQPAPAAAPKAAGPGVLTAPKATPQPAAAQPPKAPAASGGGFRIQLAAVRTEAEAQAEWKRIASRYPDAIGGLSMRVAKADLGERGIFYRVQGGSVDEARAKAICAQLKAQNVGCVVVRP